jgi:cytochrome c1
MRGARVAAIALSLALAGCAKPEPIAGDRENGRLLLRQFGCGQCHRIPGAAAAQGDTGPPLGKMRARVYLGGVLPNTPANLALWIRDPRRCDPRTTMPSLGVTAEQARDMAAYLWDAK